MASISITNHTKTDSKGFFRLYVQTPSAEDLSSFTSLARFTEELKVKAFLYVYVNDKVNASLRGFNRTYVIIRYIKPKIGVTCTPLDYTEVHKKGKISIPAVSNEEINVSIYIDGKLVGKQRLYKGFNILTINASNMTEGFHTLWIKNDPEGSYLSASYSCALTVYARVPSFKTSLNSIVIYPFQKIEFQAAVEEYAEKDDFNITLMVNGKPIYESHGPRINVSLEPPRTLMAKHYELQLVIEGRNYSRIVYNYKVLVFNPFGLTAALALVLLGFSQGLDIYVLYLPRVSINIRKLILKRTQIRIQPSSKRKPVKEPLKTTIKSRVIALYWKAVNRISVLAGEQSASETLREYLYKVRKFLAREVYVVFEKITFLAERELYSPHKPTDHEIEEVEKGIKRLDSLERK